MPYVTRQLDQIRVLGLQAGWLLQPQKQENTQRSPRAKKILQALPETPAAQGNEINVSPREAFSFIAKTTKNIYSSCYGNMNFVYVLRSLKDNGYYIGITEDIDYRLHDHNHGRVKSTSARRPLELIYFEAYHEKKYAEEREKKLKQFGSAYTGLLKRLGRK